MSLSLFNTKTGCKGCPTKVILFNWFYVVLLYDKSFGQRDTKLKEKKILQELT